MEIDHIKERVRTLIAQQLGVSQQAVTDTAKLTDDLGADSLDAVELVMAMEDEFGIEITDEQGESMRNATAQEMVQELAKHPALASN